MSAIQQLLLSNKPLAIPLTGAYISGPSEADYNSGAG